MTEPGTRALLLSDVVGAARLTERLGEQPAAAHLDAHDRIARDLLPPHRGREIDKTDGFLMLFDAAADAVAYALAYHRAIARLEPPLRARVGLHVGPVILTPNSPRDVALGAKPIEVDGLAKPTAARVMTLAVGGQTLATADAVDALGEGVARFAAGVAGQEGLVAAPVGHWQLKGVQQPVALFALGEAGVDPLLPPPDATKAWRVVPVGEGWAPARDVVHGLPRERDTFVGRGFELQALARLLDGGARVVTVYGPPGVGKTRLVLRYAWTWLGGWPGGAWFVDLSRARDLDEVAAAVAGALGHADREGEPAQVGCTLRERGRRLVLLDGLDAAMPGAWATVVEGLEDAPEARVVVTARAPLGSPGEEVFSLAPLPLADAAELFLHRAEAAKRDFRPTREDLAAIEALAGHLGGVPRAIEQAAARVRLMPPRVLLQRIGKAG